MPNDRFVTAPLPPHLIFDPDPQVAMRQARGISTMLGVVGWMPSAQLDVAVHLAALALACLPEHSGPALIERMTKMITVMAQAYRLDLEASKASKQQDEAIVAAVKAREGNA